MRSQERHGHTAHRWQSPTYCSWAHMIRRCARTSGDEYLRYGARGIRVCDRWLRSFSAFLEDMGERPEGTSIDRIDNNGNYEPGNCRWATRKVQQRNTRRSKLNDEDVRQIRILKALGIDGVWIGALFGVSKTSVNHIANHLRWRP